MTVSSRSGAIGHCTYYSSLYKWPGLTNACPLVRKGDKPDEPPDGYDTIRFGSSSRDNKGMLDKFCALERAYYFISVAIM